jgi:hypothetical protein
MSYESNEGFWLHWEEWALKHTDRQRLGKRDL